MQSKINREIFDNLLKKGKNTHSPLLSLRYMPILDNQPLSSFSFVISGKIAKKATERNLFKRRGRHIIRKLKNKINNGFVGAFFAKSGSTKVSFSEIEKEIESLLAKSGILK